MISHDPSLGDMGTRGAFSPPHLLSGAGEAALPCKTPWGERELWAADKEQGKHAGWDPSGRCDPGVEAEAEGRERPGCVPAGKWGHTAMARTSELPGQSQRVESRLR